MVMRARTQVPKVRHGNCLLLGNTTRRRVRWDALESLAALKTDRKLALTPHKVKERLRFLKKWIVDGSNCLQGRETHQSYFSRSCSSLLASWLVLNLPHFPTALAQAASRSVQRWSVCIWGKTGEEVSLMTVGRGGVWMLDSSPPPSKAGGGAEAYSTGDLTLPSPDESGSGHFILLATLHLYGLAYT